MGALAEMFKGFLAALGIPEDAALFVIVIPALILAVYVNYKK